MELTIGTPEFNNHEENFESRKTVDWYATENYRSETNNPRDDRYQPNHRK